MTTQFRLLGPLQVENAGGTVRLNGPKRRALTAYLLVHRDAPSPIERIVDALWQGGPSPGAGATVRTYVSQLRGLLGDDGPALALRHGGYVLDVEPDCIDAVRFEAAVGVALAEPSADRRLTHLEEALELWRGTPLDEFAGAAWADEVARHWIRLHLLVLERRVDALLEIGRATDALVSVETAVNEHPLHEPLWVGLMLARYRCGRQADALRAAREARQVLARELGIDPGPELVELEERILTQDPALLEPRGPASVGGQRSSLPAGVVTFLLTDIEGSTQHWESDASAMSQALLRHDELIAQAISSHGGVLLKHRGEGDSTFSVFTRATDAVAGALDAQRALGEEDWATSAPLSVRMAAHTGEALERDGDYYGRTVNRVARLRSLAAGGQILLSRSTAEVVRDHLAAGSALHELGDVSLADMDRPERVFALIADSGSGTAASAAPMEEQTPSPAEPARTAANAVESRDRESVRLASTTMEEFAEIVQPARRPKRRHNLPAKADSFVGRTDEMVSEPPFVGRDEVMTWLRGVLDEVAAGRPRVALVEGEAGTGKTAVLRHFLRRNRDAAVVEASGSPAEELVSFGFVDLLLRRLGGGVERRMVQGGEASEVGAQLLAALPVEAPGQPLVLVVDDAQWLDRPSLQALTFALRRLEADPVLTLVAARPPVSQDSALGRLVEATRAGRITLAGFDAGPVQELAARRGQQLSLAAARRLVRHTGGLPLHVAMLLEELDPATLTRASGPLPAPRSFSTAVLQRLTAAPDDTQRLVTAAAILGESCSLAVAAAVADVDDPVGAVDGAVRAGLVEHRRLPVNGDALRFTHSLVHVATLGSLAPAQAAKLHHCAAELLDSGAALDHLAAAAMVPDAGLADRLAAAGRAELAAGSVDLGAHHLLEAARLTPEPSRAWSCRLDALEALVVDGALAAADALAADLALDAWAADDAQVAYVFGHLALVRGQRDEAECLLKRAWELSGRGRDEHRGWITAIRLAQLVGIFSTDGRQQEAVIWAERAQELAGEDPVFGRPVSGICAVALALAGRPDEAVARSLPDHLTGQALTGGFTDEVLGRGIIRLWTDQFAGARADLAAVAYPAGVSEPLQTRLFGLGFLADAEYRTGQWDDGLAAAGEGIALAEDADHAWLLGLLHGMAGRLHAVRGDWSTGEEHVDTARAVAEAIGDVTDMVFYADAAAVLGAARGRPAEVVAATDIVASLTPDKGGLEAGVFAWPALRAEALVAVGRLAEATTLLKNASEVARARDRRSTMAALARARGALHAAEGDTSTAVECFGHSLEQLEGLPLPFERALTRLAYGTQLRRRGARRQAASQLSEALDEFTALGAHPARELATTELAACGLSPRRRNPAATALTPREQAVARLVADGLSNSEIAARLFLSVKTVEYHLGNAYVKLGVRNRAQLTARLASSVPGPGN